MHDGWQILTDWPALNAKATRMLRAMVEAAPPGAVATDRPDGSARGLMVYGPGSPVRHPMVKAHLARGGRVAMWDMGYWERQDAMRLSIDGLHPTPAQLELAADLPARRTFDLREDGDPAGPILLIGLGPKSVLAYRTGGFMAWEKAKVRELRGRFPGRVIRWRPKGRRVMSLPGTELWHGMPIEEAMRGCSLVVSHHSNASVDAVIAGVPFETEMGAATWFAGREITRESRAEFLRLLSWWEFSRFDAPAAWAWIEKVTRIGANVEQPT